MLQKGVEVVRLSLSFVTVKCVLRLSIRASQSMGLRLRDDSGVCTVQLSRRIASNTAQGKSPILVEKRGGSLISSY